MKCFLGLVLVLLSSTAHAFIAVRSTSSGAELHWAPGSQLTFRANTTNSSGMGASDLLSIFTASLARWKQAAHDGFSFVYYQGTDTGRYPNYVGSPYDNSIFFTSNAGQSDRLPCGVIALTQVWYDPNSGSASKADLRFNDNCFTFTNNPTDTASQSRIYLGDVATHELGHALGLDHSQALQSSMIYTAALEMSLPSCDEQTAMLHLFGGAANGVLTGAVRAPNGSAVFGAHVQAIELERGTVIGSTLSDHDGSFALKGLEPGTYSVMVEPYYPAASTLSPYYAAISSSVCNGASFDRTFQVSGGRLASVRVDAGGTSSLGTITVSCSQPGSANGGQETSFSSGPILATGAVAAPVATQSVFSSTSDHYYRLQGVSGRVSVSALAFTLFSRADVSVELLSSSGLRLPQSSSGNVFASGSGYVNFDSAASADLATAQDVYVHVFTRGVLSTSHYPAGATAVSGSSYYVLTVSNGQTSGVLAANARCESPDTFAPYSTPGDAPGFSSPSNDNGGSSGCGMIRNVGDDDPMGPGQAARLGNFFLAIGLLLAARRGLRHGGARLGHSLPTP